MNTEMMIRELNAVAEKHKNDFVPTFQTNITAMCRDIIPKLEQLSEYEAIGTVEECRKAREKQVPVKPEKIMLHGGFGYECKNCGNNLPVRLYMKYCLWCGQRLED